MNNLTKDMKIGIYAAFIMLLLFGAIGLFAWWAFTWTTHTLVWFIFIFGSLLGTVRISR